MPAPAPLDPADFAADDFVGSIEPADLVYFCCNVGDADAQVLLLPADHSGTRRAIVIDAGATGKVPELLRTVAGVNLLPLDDSQTAYPIALVVATHPHYDHTAGLGELFDQFGPSIAEFWEPGFFHTASSYHRMMQAVEAQPHIIYTQPTSGLQRWFGAVGVTVLSPSIQLRNRFDTYGVDINDASISIRIEYPGSRLVANPDGQRNYRPNLRAARLILGADAQTLSWSLRIQ
jgi:hypothetical protein